MKKNIFKSIKVLLLLMLAGTTSVIAQTVSPDDAMAKALSFISKTRKVKATNGASAQSLSLAYTSKAGDETYYYVFNNAQDGYIIIGGDEAAQDVLGYSNSGTFNYDKLPENMKWFLACYDKQISSVIKQVKEGKISAADVAKAKRAPRKAPKANIDYLLQTTWDQGGPFNCMHPFNIDNDLFTDDGDAVATGCVATAGAQIMKFHEWPTTGVGSHTDIYSFAGYTPSANFGETTYQWDKMNDEYDICSYNGDEADIAVGTLMYHVGVAVDMKFGQLMSGGSGADTRKLATALETYFKYSKGITYHERTYYSDEQWENIVYDELAAGRPVLYGGQQESGSAHAFVCDGYQDGLYHINWGWSGIYNDYFLLTPTAASGSALCPEGSGSGGGEAGEGYYMSQHIGIGITPDYDGTSKPAKSAFTRGITLVTSSTTPGGNISIDGYYCGNSSVVAQAYNVKMKFTNVADESDVTIGTYTRTTRELSSGYSESSDEAFIAPYTLEPGQSYYVTMMYENSDGEYVDMPQPQNWEPQVLEVTEPTGVALSKELVIDNGGYMSKTTGKVHFALKNYGASPFTFRNLIIYVLELVGNEYKTIGMWGFKNELFESGEEKDYSLSWSDIVQGKTKFVEGADYQVVVYNGNIMEELSPFIPLYFRADKPIDYTLTSAEWGTLCLPYNAEVPEGLTAYTVTATEGNKLVKEEVSTLECNKPYLVTGTPDTYTFEGPDTPEKENLMNGLLVGNTTAVQTYAPKASYVLQNLPAQSGLAFYEVQNDGAQKVRQYGAYLKAGSSLTSFFKFTDDATGIKEIQNSEFRMQDYYYNLNGMRVNGNTRGLVIKNGKLYINK